MSESKAPSPQSDSGESSTFRPNPETASVVIFGASGDLTARKLLPALFDLWNDGYLCDRSPIVGVARREKTDEVFRREIFEAMNGQFRGGEITPELWERFSNRLFYRQLDISVADGYPEFKQQLEAIEDQQGTGRKSDRLHGDVARPFSTRGRAPGIR